MRSFRISLAAVFIGTLLLASFALADIPNGKDNTPLLHQLTHESFFGNQSVATADNMNSSEVHGYYSNAWSKSADRNIYFSSDFGGGEQSNTPLNAQLTRHSAFIGDQSVASTDTNVSDVHGYYPSVETGMSSSFNYGGGEQNNDPLSVQVIR